MKYFFIPVSLLFVFILASCNQGGVTSINDGGGSVGMWTIPGIGTEYIYENLQSPNDELDTVTILKTGQHIGGKTNIVSITDRFDGDIDTGFYNIETNGDFSFGDPDDSLGILITIIGWEIYPTGSRQAINVEPPFNSVTARGEHIVNSDVNTFVGVENITVPAGRFSTLHVRKTQIDDQIFPNDSLGFSSTDTLNTDFWFATSAGIYVKVVSSEMDSGQNDDQSNVVMTKYSPR